MSNRLLVALVGLLGYLPIAYAQDACPKAPTFPNTVKDCNAWHTIVDGDNCENVPAKYGKTKAQFLEWNPDVSSDCLTNFWLGNAYCVGTGTSRCTTTTTTTTRSSTRTTSRSSLTSSVNATYSTRWPITASNITTIPVETAWPPTRTQAGQPGGCNSWYYVQPADTCQTIVNVHGGAISLANLVAWNPTLMQDCSGLYVGWWVCVGLKPTGSSTIIWSRPTGNGTAEVPTATTHTRTTTTDVPDFTPSPAQPGMPTTCQAYYQAQPDENCDTVLAQYSYITKDQFFDWNPALEENCNGLWLNYYYCVANFDENTPPPMPTTTVKPTSKVAEGIVADCKAWYMVPDDDDTCDDVLELFGAAFTREDFTRWNPTVLPDCSGIRGQLFYCVAVPGTPTTRPPNPSTTTRPPVETPTGCALMWMVVEGDTCTSIGANYGITVPSLMALNRDLLGEGSSTTECNARLVLDTWLCVRAESTGGGPIFPDDPTSSGPVPSSTSGGGVTSTTTSRATTTTGGGGGVSTPTPTQPGMIDGCIRFYWHGTAGDGCWAIANANGISLDDFYKWNTGVGTDCSALWLNAYHCIGVSGSPTTIGGPQPT